MVMMVVMKVMMVVMMIVVMLVKYDGDDNHGCDIG